MSCGPGAARAWARTLGPWLLLGLTLGCPQPEAETLIAKSRCLTDADCEPEARCDLARQQCYRERPDHPYLVLLQVYPQPDAFALVEQYDTSFPLSVSRDDVAISVPASVTIPSRVAANGAAIEAEVTFTPSQQNAALPSTSIIVNARQRDDNGTRNMSARLTPGVLYDVRVQPLVRASEELPPMMTIYQVPEPLDLSYGEMTRLRARLVDEDGKLVSGHRVRLEHAQSGAVLSSTTETNEAGELSLFADAAVLASEPFKLAISLPPFPPFRVKVALDGSQLKADAMVIVTMPKVPSPVAYRGSVRSPSASATPVPYADVQLVSSFEYTMSGTMSAMGNVDWCRFRYAENSGRSLSCSARVATTSNQLGEYTVDLLPGIYEIFATPTSEVPSSQLLATNTETLRVETQPPGVEQGGFAVPVARAARYRGQINSYDGRPLPNVSVTARALAYAGVVGELGRYNRSVTAITDRRGRFELALDQGYFDLVIEPPADSGFAWSGSLNRIFDLRETGGALRPISASSPVYVAGQVQQAGSKRALAGARIEAYALVSSLSGGQRAVRIGQTSSDAEGNYRLALPATIGDELCTAATKAKCDCGMNVLVDRTCSEAGTFNTCECRGLTDKSRPAR